MLLKKNKQTTEQKLNDVTIHNEKAQAELLKKLEQNNLLDDTFFDIINAETFAKSLIISEFNNPSKETTTSLLKTKKIITDKNEPLTLFVYKTVIKEVRKDRTFLHFVTLNSKNQKHYAIKPYYISKNKGNFLSSDSEIDEIIEKTTLLIKHKSRRRLSNYRY